MFSVLTGFETRNRYEIKNSLGQRVYFASEDTDCCTRNCWGPSRPFTMRVLDNLGREVVTLERPLRCACCCCPCCLQEVGERLAAIFTNTLQSSSVGIFTVSVNLYNKVRFKGEVGHQLSGYARE